MGKRTDTFLINNGSKKDSVLYNHAIKLLAIKFTVLYKNLKFFH